MKIAKFMDYEDWAKKVGQPKSEADYLLQLKRDIRLVEQWSRRTGAEVVLEIPEAYEDAARSNRPG